MFIVADIGGTKMRVAGSEDGEHLGEPVSYDSPLSYAEGIALFKESADRIKGQNKIDGVAVGITGVVSRDGGSSITAPHLPDWREKPLRNDLSAALGAPVHLYNDTSLVGLGEAVFGAGKGAGIVVYITVSTGVNGARIVNSKIDGGVWGAEIGGQYLLVDGKSKSLENLISGAAIQEKYGKHPKEIEKDSPIWEELSMLTAYGVHNTILHWSPDRVVLGGSMFNEIGIPVPRVYDHVKEIMKKFPTVPDIVHSDLKDAGGLWGGLALLKQSA